MRDWAPTVRVAVLESEALWAPEPPVAEPSEPEIGGLGTRTTRETEEKLCNDVLWSVDVRRVLLG